MAKIQKTTDYSRFDNLVANRALNPAHVLNITNSLKIKNLLHLNPIIVDGDFRVIDGQHRLAAAERLGLDVYYIQDKDISIQDVRLLNTHVKGWGMTDYLHTYIAEGKEDYVKTHEFCRKHGITISMAMAILNLDIEKADFGAPYRLFKSGEFKIKDQALSDEFVEFYKQAAKYTVETTWRDRDFVRTLWRVYRMEEINPEDFLTQLERYAKPIYRSAGVKEYSRQFEDILNYGVKGANLRLY